MKKTVLCTLILLFLFTAAGCKKEEFKISAEDNYTVNTIYAKADGKLQVAMVDAFDKPYYNLTELEEFAQNEINVYNKETSAERVKMDDIRLKSGNAVILLSFAGMNDYANFNHALCAYFNGGVYDLSQNTMKLPDTLLDAKSKAATPIGDVLGNGKYKILVMSEPYDIIVDGTVKYYSDNSTLAEKNKVNAGEGMTVVVFKP